jgi:hypothetical protein
MHVRREFYLSILREFAGEPKTTGEAGLTEGLRVSILGSGSQLGADVAFHRQPDFLPEVFSPSTGLRRIGDHTGHLIFLL